MSTIVPEESQSSLDEFDKPKSLPGRVLRFLEEYFEKPGANQHEKISKMTFILVVALAWDSFGREAAQLALALV